MEPDLPLLLPSHFNPSQKRVRHSSFTALSSDPAIFSSDDDPSAENYLFARRKKKFRGPWYAQVLASEGNSQDGEEKKVDGGGGAEKRKFERRFDSGVFMGSDGTDMGDLEGLEENKMARGIPMRQQLKVQERDWEEVLVEDVVERCLDEGNEIIDLSSRRLSKLSNASIRPLATFTIVPPVSQDVFQHLEPNLKIFLSQNLLERLPEELFHLERLTALSLRSNQLRELPAAIGKLHNLTELNLALNRFEYLPYEILELFTQDSSLQKFTVHPNPFIQPEIPLEKIPIAGQEGEEEEEASRQSCRRKAVERSAKSRYSESLGYGSGKQWRTVFKHRSEVRFFSKTGKLIRGPSFERTEDTTSPHLTIPTTSLSTTISPPPPTDTFSSHAPSLLELSLQSCLSSTQAPLLPSYLPEDAPQHLSTLLTSTLLQKESGLDRCTRCRRKMAIKRTEWLEWWQISRNTNMSAVGSAASPLRRMENWSERDQGEKMIPFVRRGCCWSCGPDVVDVSPVDVDIADQNR